ncbi:MAG: hypothetical protein CVU57_29950 [Deltaproteobacteria bacterium HGW-Deltaproteobacteria-15]|jgi:hypothetical protein|nr:MAG: hypothetical protein CVU57_29950 [Deltaproteobacteria bacterium HGW-Deltaproteobacteria-15]
MKRGGVLCFRQASACNWLCLASNQRIDVPRILDNIESSLPALKDTLGELLTHVSYRNDHLMRMMEGVRLVEDRGSGIKAIRNPIRNERVVDTLAPKHQE